MEIYDSDDVVIELLKDKDGTEYLRISYFKDFHYQGESVITDVFNQDKSCFIKT